MSQMGFFADLMNRLPFGEGGGAVQGLDLAETTIQSVITTIQQEQDDLDPATFESNGHISAGSFGGADKASALALHHTRAHGVTADTLHGVVTDLTNFQQACRDAKQAVVDADEQTSDRIRYTQLAVDRLAYGARTNHGEQALTQAQRDHKYDRPTDAPVGDETTGDA